MEVRFRKFLKDVTPEQVEIIKGTGIKSAVLFVIHAPGDLVEYYYERAGFCQISPGEFGEVKEVILDLNRQLREKELDGLSDGGSMNIWVSYEFPDAHAAATAARSIKGFVGRELENSWGEEFVKHSVRQSKDRIIIDITVPSLPLAERLVGAIDRAASARGGYDAHVTNSQQEHAR
ncbi:MAG: hypothetical protein COV36_03095 [Alphaproteobacteria bacterium CG11_big_fil_rev_8_21_14_0_20_44_7]|nr:MAG: hypothetical protein COV36_03095 [Alphaproteobacteria bacterium CG11_big_fil_rev_8_21_14_0_20_44_7]